MYRVHRRHGAGERLFPSIWDSSEAWAACAQALREYDEHMIQDWKEEIDTLLVFVSIRCTPITAPARLPACGSGRLVYSPLS